MNKLHNIVALSLIATVLTAPTWILAQGETSPTNTPNVISINFNSAGGSVSSEILTGIVSAKNWNNTTGNIATVGSLKDSNNTITTASVTHSAKNTWTYHSSITDIFLKGYLDDGSPITITMSDIPFPVYDVIIYHATDTASYQFNPPAVNGFYYTWDSTNKVTILATEQTRNATANRYGQSQQPTAVLGKNALRINGLVGPLEILGAGNANSARGCIAAIQVIQASNAISSMSLSADATWSSATWTTDALPSPWVNDGESIAEITVTGTPTLTFDNLGSPTGFVDAKVITFSSEAEASVALAVTSTTSVKVDMLDLSKLKGSLIIPANPNIDIGGLLYQADPSKKIIIDTTGVDFSNAVTTIFTFTKVEIPFNRLEARGLPAGAIIRRTGNEIQVLKSEAIIFNTPVNWFNVPTTVVEDIPTASLSEYIDNVDAYQTVGGRNIIAVHVMDGNTSTGGVYGLHSHNNRGNSTLNKDVYIKVSGGTHNVVTAGQLSDWPDNRRTNLTGNQFTEITGNAVVNHVLGAGDKAGFGPTLTGNTAIVIDGNATVKGNIIGGWTSAHAQTGTVTGNTSIRITKVLDLATVSMNGFGVGWILGGGVKTGGPWSKSLVTGDTVIAIDLPTGATGTFARKIVGGAYANSNNGTHSVDGSSTVTITAPNAVTFSGEIYGGGYRQSGTLKNKGLATLSLNGGTYTSTITAGSLNNTITDIGPAALAITGCIFDGATLRTGAATGNKTLIFNGEASFTGASNITAGFTSASVTRGATLTLGGTTQVNSPINVVEGGILKLGGTTQIHSPMTGNVTVTDGVVVASNTEVFVGATVIFEPNAKVNISITEAQKLALTTPGSIIAIKLFNVLTGSDAATIGTHVQLKYAEEAALTGLAFSIVDGVLYVTNTATDTILLAPFSTVITESTDWTLATWQDANGSNVTTGAWDTAVPSANITVPINQAATLTIDQPIIVGTLNLLTPAEATAASVFTLMPKPSTTGAMTVSIIDASTSTQSITLDLPTGTAEVRAGTNTILTQAGTGSLIIGAGKKATLRDTNRATVTNNGTLIYEGIQTGVTPTNAGNIVEIDTAMSFGAYALNAKHLKVKPQGNVTIAGVFTINNHNNLTVDGSRFTASSIDVRGDDGSNSHMIITNGGQLIVNGDCSIAWYNPTAAFKWEISGEGSLLKANKIKVGNVYQNNLPNIYVKDNAMLSIGSGGIANHHNYGVANFYYDGGILTAHADWTHHNNTTTYITKGSTMTIDPASHTITYNKPIVDATGEGEGGGTLVIGRADTTGTVKLSAMNTYTGGTTLNAGILDVSHVQALGTGPFAVVRGSTLKLTSLNGSIDAPALTITAVTGNTGVINITHPLTEAQLAGDPIKLITIPEGVTVDDFAWTFVDGETVIDPSTYSLTSDAVTRIVSVQAVPITITITDGNVVPEVATFVNTLADGATVSLTADQANLLYLFNVTSWPANLATVSFKITDCVVLTGATVSLTVTLEGVTAGDDLNGVVSLKRGASLVSLTALTQGVTSTREGNTFTLTTAVTEGESFFKAVVTK